MLPPIDKPSKRNVRTRPMTPDESYIFISLVMTEIKEGHSPVIETEEQFLALNPNEETNMFFFPLAILKRIKALNLPIKFTNSALLATLAFTDRIGGAILLLVDCLEEFEGKIVGLDELTALYPMGFYDLDKTESHSTLDDQLKKNGKQRSKWSYVYE